MPRSEKLAQLYESHKMLYAKKKKHICTTCQRPFTTSGHLARHSRVHTGERNHRCPFPGCETRCSRQDNLQQHYRIHLSPNSRRNSVRANTPRKSPSSVSSSSRSPESVTLQHPGTPPLDQGRMYDRTPPLGHATLPSANTLLNSSISGRIYSSSSPSTSYSPGPHHVLPALSCPGLPLPVSSSPNYNYRTATPSYHDQSLANYPTYVNNATGASQNGSHNAVGSSNYYAFSQSHSNYDDHSEQTSRSTSPSSVMQSRHSLSHINHSRYPSSNRFPSPNSVSSHSSAHSGPPTPTYPVSYADTHTYSHPHGGAMVTSQPAVHNNTQMQSQSYLFQNAYTPNTVMAHSPRYLPPLTLAPIQDERYTRRLETPRPSYPYLHHSQPLAGYSQYQHSLGIGHGAWKTEVMRKGVGAAVI